jgi:hypothetical protein
MAAPTALAAADGMTGLGFPLGQVRGTPETGCTDPRAKKRDPGTPWIEPWVIYSRIPLIYGGKALTTCRSGKTARSFVQNT